MAKELWLIFLNGCKETPKGMVMPFVVFITTAKQSWNAKAFFAPFVACWQTALHNPILEKIDKRR